MHAVGSSEGGSRDQWVLGMEMWPHWRNPQMEDKTIAVCAETSGGERKVSQRTVPSVAVAATELCHVGYRDHQVHLA